MNSIINPLLCLVLILGSSATAFALRGDLDAPGIAFPAGYQAREQVMAALHDPEAKFEGGHFINARTVLRYSGSTDALNRMLKELVKAPATVVSVSFARFEKADWKVEHEGMRFEFKINLNSESIQLEKLSIPEATGPK